jgi:hypothetical protein
MLGELKGPFPFGVVLVQDEGATKRIPRWSSRSQQVTAVDDAMVIKIQHEVDGPATVRVWDDMPAIIDGIALATVRLVVPSGRLVVATAELEPAIEVPVPKGSVRVVVLGSEASDAAEIDLIVRPDERPQELGEG